MTYRTHTLAVLLTAAMSFSPALAAAKKPAVAVAAVAPTPAVAQTLSYDRVGKGPAVVLIHGLGGDRALWAQEAARLSARYTVISVDLPGHGRSPTPKSLDLKETAQQVAKIIHHEHLSPAVIVGHSMGGTVAAWVPLVAPETARGVLLVDAVLAPIPWTDEDKRKLRVDLNRARITTLRQFYARMTSNATQLDRVISAAQSVSTDTFMAYVDYASDNELDEKVRDIRCPVHLLAGTMLLGDNGDPKKTQAALQQAGYVGIPKFTHEYFAGAKHFLFWDDPTHFNVALDRFIGTISHPSVSGIKGRSKG